MVRQSLGSAILAALALHASLLPLAAFAAPPVAPASPVTPQYRQEPATAPLDADTASDLELSQLVTHIFGGTSWTPFGRMRMQWLLENPYTDEAEILRRQRIIAALAEDPELLAQLENAFTRYYEGLPADWRNANSDVLFKTFITEFDRLHFLPYNAQTGGRSVVGFAGESAGAFFNIVLFTSIVNSMIEKFGRSEINVSTMAYVGVVGAFFLARGALELYTRRRAALPTLVTTRRLLDLSRTVTEAMRRSPDASLREVPAGCSDRGICRRLVEGVMRLTQAERGLVAASMVGTGINDILKPFAGLSVVPVKASIRQSFALLGELEVFVRAARFYASHRDQMVFPSIVNSGTTTLRIEQGVHPLQVDLVSAQPNDVNLSADFSRGEFKTRILTGPNAGGKTTYLRLVGVLPIMAQIGLPVPARRMEWTPTQVVTIFTGRSDATNEASTFMRQGQRVARVGAFLGFDPGVPAAPNLLVLADEILTGTSTSEHRASERAVIETIHLDGPNALAIIATHDRSQNSLAELHPGIGTIQVALTPPFSIVPGPSLTHNAFATLSRPEVGLQEPFLARMRGPMSNMVDPCEQKYR